ncbi:MAG: efflux RND transporter permease subunit, partial [Spirochaetes bacterium]|nr:efflux RND transporter permease subunit [Spirochaetota bacterium]
GIRTPVGIKIFGANLNEIQRLGGEIETLMRTVPGPRSIYAERVGGGYYVDITPRRAELARYGLGIDDLQMVVMSAVGGETVSTTVEGRERYTINVRYPRDFRGDLDGLSRVLVTTRSGVQVPLGSLADLSLAYGPAMIRDENGRLSGYVYVDIAGRDVGSYVAEAKELVRTHLNLPTGYSLTWSGQYENMQRVEERLKVVLPITIFLIIVLLYMNTKSAVKSFIVLLAVPFSLVGAVWLLYILGYNVSIAVWVGMIALMGLDAETGVFMLLFLDLSYEDAKRKGLLRNDGELKEAVVHGAVKRIRPKIMTVATAFLGLMPIMWSLGTGADVMKRIAAPMIGGLLTSFVLELLVYPAVYYLWRRRELKDYYL